MATAVNPDARAALRSPSRPRTTIRMGASLFIIKASRPPFPPAVRDVNAEIMERCGPATFDRQRRNGHKVDAYLSQLAAAICLAHGIGSQPRPQRTPRKDRRSRFTEAADRFLSPLSM